MENLLCIRPYKQEDEPYCKELAESAFMVLLNPLYTNFIIARNRFQILLALFTCKLYWWGNPFPYFLMCPIIIACGIYIMLYLLFWKIIQDSQKEAFDAARNYNVNDDNCFWVAEVYHYRFVKNFRPYLRYTWLTETELQKSNINLSDYNKKIVGFIGMNKNVRNNNCAMLNEFIVHHDYRRKGIGTQLIKTVLKFCDEKKYTRVNLQFFEFMTNAISLSKKLGFKYYGTQSKLFFPLLVEVKMYEFSYLTQVTKPTVSVKTNEQMSTKSVTPIQKSRQVTKPTVSIETNEKMSTKSVTPIQKSRQVTRPTVSIETNEQMSTKSVTPIQKSRQVTRPTVSVKTNEQMSIKSVTPIQKRRYLRHLNF